MTELTLKAALENIPQVTAFIDQLLEDNGCSLKAQMQIDVAIDELFSNIARYAYGNKAGDATVQFDYDPAKRMAVITFVDCGAPFDPLGKRDPDVSLSAAERAVGGLGIYLVKKTMDDLKYRYENGRNILTLYKHI